MAEVRRRVVLAGIGSTLLVPTSVSAQVDWPKGPIKFIVPFPPGGGTDPIARIIAGKLGDNTGWQIVVENKPGAAGVIGATAAAKSAPDGQTWMVTFDSHILSAAFTPNLTYKDSDLFNVMLVGRTPLVITCPPDRPWKDFAEVVADARKRPGQLSIGMLSASQALLLMTHVRKENGFDANFIFYKGGGPTVQDALAGVTDMCITTLVSAVPYCRTGKLHALATTGEKRPPALPETPTLSEQGIKSYPTYSWWGLYAPAGMPRPIVDRMNTELAKAVRSPDVMQKFVEQIHLEVLASSPEEFAAFHKAEQERWFKVIKDNDIKATD
jgi:tripartite-type tricarboxylate transporter receptor subunit TctC